MKGNIPVLFVEGKNLPEAWENSLKALYEKGCSIKTEYDRFEDPPSKDCSMTIVIEDPLSEPMLHLDLPVCLEDLQEYVLEITDGIKDHLVREWAQDTYGPVGDYTYHQRLFNYTVPGEKTVYNQIDSIIQKIAKTPLTRRAQAVSWKVWEDMDGRDPSSLQGIWVRLLPGDNNIWYLNSNVHFRSEDAYRVTYLNIFSLIQLLKNIADKIALITGYHIKLGRYTHQVDSYSIYGRCLQDFERSFLKTLNDKTFEQRTALYSSMKIVMDDAIPDILKKVKSME